MKYKFQIEGIDCWACVREVINVLEEHKVIERVIVLSRPMGLTFIDMNDKLTEFELQVQLAKIGGYAISELKL